MPGGDGTGPGGQGPMTGRAAGYCAGYATPGFQSAGFGRGIGGGWGRGRRNQFYATGLTGWQRAGMRGPVNIPASAPPDAPMATQEQQVNALKSQVEYFENALAGIREQIAAMEEKAD